MKKLFLLLTIGGVIFFFSQCMHVKKSDDPRGPAYAGSAACVQCHQTIYTSYLHTAHYQSSAPASPASIAGSFSKDSNTLVLTDSSKVVMEIRDGVPWQVMYLHDMKVTAQRFDIVFGKVKGQSYLYWKDDLLFQLPVSYLAVLHNWTNSPGYRPGRADFSRPVERRCFECHSSYIGQPVNQTAIVSTNAMDKSTAIYNIDCERCHGPAQQHVEYHVSNPTEKDPKYIVSIKSLTRLEKINNCAVCHSGNKNYMLKSTFAFKPGDTLSHFMVADIQGGASPDVHGNQTQLLAMSKCFLNSNMDCSTCHNTHASDRGDAAAYSIHCQDCHSAANHNFCTKADTLHLSFFKQNCTTCHMPALPSKAIVVQTAKNGSATASLVVSHRIAVYAAIAEKILEQSKENNYEKKNQITPASFIR